MITTVNDSENNSEEILLHYSGHHAEHRIYLRLKTKQSEKISENEYTNDYPILQISCSNNFGLVSTSGNGNEFFIKLKQLI